MGVRSVDQQAARRAMIEGQLRRRGISAPRILDAFGSVPREQFVGNEFANLAYGDHPLPIAGGQTISQPYIVGLMIEAAAIASRDRVLEVGAGSGYAAAVISRLASLVIGIERNQDLVAVARDRLLRLGFDNITIVGGDGSKGWPDQAPYDVIIGSASGTHVPASLIAQLASDGRLVMPIGKPGSVQKLVKLIKRKDGSLEQTDLGSVRFVPLIGDAGWKDA